MRIETLSNGGEKMYIAVTQIEKELGTAHFVISDERNNVGTFDVHGGIGLAPVVGVLSMHETTTTVRPLMGWLGLQYRSSKHFGLMFKPARIEASEVGVGTAYQKFVRYGKEEVPITHIRLGDRHWQLYFCSLGGNMGIKWSLYEMIDEDEKQIAEIDSDSVIYNDLHNFRIFAETGEALRIALWAVSYIYLCNIYDARNRGIGSITKIDARSNEFLMSKYNPGFVEEAIRKT
jgi:hypothetical protein